MEVLQLTKFGDISEKDIKGGARHASLWYHPDNGGTASAFGVVQACKTILLDPAFMMPYRFEAMQILAQNPTEETEEARRDGYESLFHKYTSPEHQSSAKAEQQQPSTGTEQVERLHVFLDNSHSMSWNGLQEAHAIFAQLDDRFSRNDCSVHFIGCRGMSFLFMDFFSGSRLFSDGEVNIPEVLNAWSADGGRTFLWEYMYNQLRVMDAGSNEVMIITDGCDNDSAGEFNGATGFNAMMTRLLELGIELRINVLSLGSDACEGTGNNDLAHATGGVYVHAMNEKEATPFIEHMLSSHATRERLALGFQKQYQARLAGGNALLLPWFGDLSKLQEKAKPTKSKTNLEELGFRKYTVNRGNDGGL